MKRLGMVIGIREDKVEEYKRLHANVWPDVLQNLTDLNCKNYSIFLRGNLLFSYMEYWGDNYDRDMRLMAENKTVQKWWAICTPCQIPMADRKKGEWWAPMEEVFYHE